jgi:aspartyl-tRNA(Asn)/glutamyl-tRNA(Gln) amidotransferase subunit B
MEYQVSIGLEVHVQLSTTTKAFCGCPTTFGAKPNTSVCPICLGMPGTLPVLNEKAFDYAIKTALALNCHISNLTKFDRKNYFYPDLPKNFQISQYDTPLSYDGYLEVETEGERKKIRIKRVHLEEDAGKLIHKKGVSLVDFNRSGTPLLEIVSEPDITSAQCAHSYLTKLKSILRYLRVSDCNMEEGSLRCDANVSLRKMGTKTLGVKTEVKNMNSFKAVRQALEYEIERQKEVLKDGQEVIQETRLWDESRCKTFSMRSKEEAFDYRYFPEPDLPVFRISKDKINKIKESLPELPDEKKTRFMKKYGLSNYDASILTEDINLADYFEETNKILNNPKAVANWIIGPIFKELNERNIELGSLKDKIKPQDLSELIKLVLDGKINITSAKEKAIPMLIESSEDQPVLIEEIGKELAQISDIQKLEVIVSKVIKENQKSVQDYIGGKEKAIMFLVGQVMRQTKGKANPQMVRKILEERLKKNNK